MADTDVWGLGGPIAAPAATDRAPWATAPGAGGYSLRGDFGWKDASGRFIMEGGGANGAALINCVYTVSTTALRYTLNNGAGGGFLSAYNLENNFTHNAEFISGSGYVARHTDAARYQQASGAHSWTGNNGLTIGAAFTPTERMRLDAAGNLGIGVSAAARLHVKSSGEVVRLETTAARGAGLCFFDFYDTTGQKSYFGYAGLDDVFYQMNRTNAGIIFGTNDINRWLIAANGMFLPQADNAYDLGVAGTNRIRNIYLVNSPSVTSDERDKTWLGAANEAELRASKRIAAQLGFYQWNDEIAEKGADGAPLNFGVRAQQVWAIMADEGLIEPLAEGVAPASRYAFLCCDEWDEETRPAMEEVVVEKIRIVQRPSSILNPLTGEPVMVDEEETYTEMEWQPTGGTEVVREAGYRLGIRPDQLALFLIAAQEARLAALEAA